VGGGGGLVVRPTRSVKLIFHMKTFYFLPSTDVKLLSQIKGNSVNYCDFFFKFVISLRFGRCGFSTRAPKKPLLRCVFQRSMLSHYMGGPKTQRTLLTELATRHVWTGWVVLRLSVYSRNADTQLIR